MALDGINMHVKTVDMIVRPSVGRHTGWAGTSLDDLLARIGIKKLLMTWSMGRIQSDPVVWNPFLEWYLSVMICDGSVLNDCCSFVVRKRSVPCPVTKSTHRSDGFSPCLNYPVCLLISSSDWHSTQRPLRPLAPCPSLPVLFRGV